MGIERIRLGKRSRVLEEQERAETITSCGCGKMHLPDKADLLDLDGTLHRYSGVCKPAPPTRTTDEELRLENQRLRDRNRFLQGQLDAIHNVLARRPFGSAWEAAHEPLPPPVAGQEPEAAGLRAEVDP